MLEVRFFHTFNISNFAFFVICRYMVLFFPLSRSLAWVACALTEGFEVSLSHVSNLECELSVK